MTTITSRASGDAKNKSVSSSRIKIQINVSGRRMIKINIKSWIIKNLINVAGSEIIIMKIRKFSGNRIVNKFK